MSISRRRFLGGLATGAGALAAGRRAEGGHQHFAGYPGRMGLLHDTTLCVGCRSCEQACHEVNKLPAAPPPADADTRVRRTTEKDYTVVNRYLAAEADRPAVFRKHQCMHCNEPCCASVCFVKAFTKTPEGPVLYDASVCVGCRYCVMVCPYDALAYEYDDPLTPRVVRCTMCYDLVKQGQPPACAAACPTGAITFGRREDLLQVARARMLKRPERYIPHIFGENEFGGTSWLTLAGVDFARLGLPSGESHTPLPEFGAGFLGVVPLVLTIYPGLLLGIYAFNQRRDKLARQEQQQAVAEALTRADEETRKKLAEATERATKQKDQAVQAAVKRALAEAEKQAAAAAAAAQTAADAPPAGKAQPKEEG